MGTGDHGNSFSCSRYTEGETLFVQPAGKSLFSDTAEILYKHEMIQIGKLTKCFNDFDV